MTKMLPTSFILEKDDAAIRSLLAQVITAFNAADIEGLLALHSDDVILMEPNMPLIQGKKAAQELLAAFKEQGITMQLQVDIDELEVSLNRAFVRGRLRKKVFQQLGTAEEETGKFMTLLKKQQDGSWLRTHVMVNGDGPQ